MNLDILYLAWNRMQFTMDTFEWMVAHTRWKWVTKLIVYDDGSEDGTQEFLRDAVDRCTVVDVELRLSDLRSPPAVMNHYLATSEAEWFVKLDNDIALPGGWLEKIVRAHNANPEYELIGMEAGMVALDGRDGVRHGGYSVTESSHIGGVGLMNVDAFRARPRIPERGRFGFTEWQDRYQPVRGWVTPDILCPQLDRVPIDRYRKLSEQYVKEGWQRAWSPYDEKWMAPYWEWMLPKEEDEHQ
jgi:glycosyltransferase involved in cell wall biosynthesis